MFLNNTGKHFSMGLATLLCCLCLGTAQQAIAEQYRSKLYLDPSQQLGENISLSLEDLEKQIGTMTDTYSKSSAGRHLARHYVNENNYPKAIEFYETALQEEGLSDVANQEMLKELATVYILQKNYRKAVSTINRLQVLSPKLDLPMQLISAQAQFGMGNYLAVADTLDKVLPQINQLTEQQLKQMMALYYRIGSYQQCVPILQRLIDKKPQSFNYWQQLTSIYLKQNQYKKALNQLELARQKKLPFQTKDIILLADLYVANQAAEKGARLLEAAITSGRVANNEKNNKRLFEYWLQAREKDKATQALQRAIKSSSNTNLFLHLAQLQMEQENWQAMNSTVLSACERVLADKHVSRANLLLGISQLKLGNNAGARISLINATLISGAGEKAQQWLLYINASPPQSDELRQITGPCHPEDRRVPYIKITAQLDSKTSPSDIDESAESERVQVKTVPPTLFFGINLSAKQNQLGAVIKKSALPMGVSLVKSGGSIDGALHLLFEGDSTSDEILNFYLAFPSRGLPNARGRYKLKKGAAFNCTYATYTGPGDGIPEEWRKLYEKADEEGLTLSGENRMIFKRTRGAPANHVSVELQLGVLL